MVGGGGSVGYLVGAWSLGDWRLPGCNMEGEVCGLPSCHMSAAGGNGVYLSATWRGRAAIYLVTT
jgi:hypothetical protein